MDEFVQELRDEGGLADVFFADATKEEDMSSLIETIEKMLVRSSVPRIMLAHKWVTSQLRRRVCSNINSPYRWSRWTISDGKNVESPYDKAWTGNDDLYSATAAFRGNEMQPLIPLPWVREGIALSIFKP